jgi:hypothetical protein
MVKCGFCSQRGHNIRSCNSQPAQNLLSDYRRTCMTPRTDQELSNFFRQYTSDMLSLIMVSYGASSVSISRAEKEIYLRNQILGVNQQPPAHVVAPRPARIVAPPNFRQQMVQVGQQVILMREPLDAYKARMKVISDELFEAVCINEYGIPRYDPNIVPQFGQMIISLSVVITRQTRYAFGDAVYIKNLLIKKFRLPRLVAPIIKTFFYDSILAEYHRMTRAPVATDHKPQFVNIPICYTQSTDDDVDTEEYICGVCQDEFTTKTIVVLGCVHILCCDCITGIVGARTKSFVNCPLCREEIKHIIVQDVTIKDQISLLITTEINK